MQHHSIQKEPAKESPKEPLMSSPTSLTAYGIDARL